MSDLTERLAEALEVCDAATDGPWEATWEYDDQWYSLTGQPHDGLVCPEVATVEAGGGADAEFIAHARTGYPAALRALQAVLNTIEDYPVPSKYDDPTGDIGGAVEAFGRAVEQSITEHLGGAQ